MICLRSLKCRKEDTMNSVNQNIKPISASINKVGNLEIGGCDAVELVERFGTPLYVIDEATLRGICREFKKAFKNYPSVNMMYASKALCTSAIAKIVASEGFGFDVVSAGEIYTCHRAGVDMSKVLFNGNNKGYEEIILALDLGVGRFSVDNFFELALLDEIAASENKVVDILLRITPGIECHTHEYIKTGHLDSKFGFDLTQIDDAVELIVNEYKNLNLKGLHAHIGSQIFETKVFEDEIDILFGEIARLNGKFALKLNEMNIGGGLAVKYTDEDVPPSVFDIAKVITESVEKSSNKYGLEKPILFLEPGRSIISTSGVTLYTVGSSKQVPQGRKYVALDGGMADNPRPSLYGAKYCAVKANVNDNEETETITLAGKFCESGDILIEDVVLPKLEAGDVVCVFNTGAYNYSMASNYNRREKPAMVLVNDSNADIIIRRESLDDLVANDVIPERLRDK